MRVLSVYLDLDEMIYTFDSDTIESCLKFIVHELNFTIR